MGYLVSVTVLWAFSFSLIGVYLAGQVDPYFAVLSRILLALLLFSPLLLRYRFASNLVLPVIGLGALQLGLMYLFYYQSFLLLSVAEVLVFTIFTPLYITLLHDVLAKRFNPQFLLAALIAVLAAAIMRYQSLSEHYWTGFSVVQGANLCFALGQVGYKRLLAGHPDIKQYQLFGWFYVGAALIAIPAWLLLGNEHYPSTTVHWTVLLWLGLVASGLGYYGWNKGATQVSSGMLAVMNNALIPAGLLVNVIIWQRDTDIVRLSIGCAMIGFSIWLCRRPAGQGG
ncbi:carboxylate/amino acid/amine transporter [Arsukibacterium tuosuense]|uniref:Carboxylate/amino acid/amine transporter n=1 Tax=Arsukibacterium tuosuense TaxID=1323745 RepID=A0A285HZE2_9GAMM|nr:EamA family transporter [Arsukibacterium tuosuense]SNY41092.1 carboxylate/amino acid/amine transporter [Arsukibacterium tuosuense]